MRGLAVLLRIVALLVPAIQRGRWREEWLAELHQIAARRGGAASLHAARGVFRDAVAMRRMVATRRHARTGAGLFSAFSAMDFTLGVRMLVRYPGLTAVAVLGLAVGIMISAGAFSILYTLTDPALPVEEGDRVITIQNMDAARNAPERRILHDLADWREGLASVEDVGAFRQVSRNLLVPGSQAEPVTVAEISASAFRVARVPPLMGRSLQDADER